MYQIKTLILNQYKNYTDLKKSISSPNMLEKFLVYFCYFVFICDLFLYAGLPAILIVLAKSGLIYVSLLRSFIASIELLFLQHNLLFTEDGSIRIDSMVSFTFLINKPVFKLGIGTLFATGTFSLFGPFTLKTEDDNSVLGDSNSKFFALGRKMGLLEATNVEQAKAHKILLEENNALKSKNKRISMELSLEKQTNYIWSDMYKVLGYDKKVLDALYKEQFNKEENLYVSEEEKRNFDLKRKAFDAIKEESQNVVAKTPILEEENKSSKLKK